MVKMYENLWLFGPDLGQELSILESRKHNQAVVSRQTAEDYKSLLLHNGSTSAVKLVFFKEDFGNPLH